MKSTTDEIEIQPDGSPVDGIEHRATWPDGSIIIAYREQDSDCSNPCEDCDGMGHIRSLSNRHINNIDHEEAVELLKSDKMVVPLSYYEHGNSLWDVMNGDRIARCPDAQWDQVQFAGVWVPDDSCRDEIKSRSRRKRITYRAAATELAKSCCEEYTDWVNGNCYGCIVEMFDSEGNYVKQLDSCWGFIGDYSEKALLEMFTPYSHAELAEANAI